MSEADVRAMDDYMDSAESCEPPEIPFTQYLMPDGRQKDIGFPCESNDVYRKAMSLIERGAVFEAEVLSTGHVSLECLFSTEPDPTSLAMRVCQNGPPVVEAVKSLVLEAWKVAEP